MRKIAFFSVILEVIGISGTGMGLGIEMICHADYGYIAITGGSLVIAVGGLLWAKLLRKG